MVGKADWSGRRVKPFRYYLCGRKNREGYDSCPSGKIQAEGPEESVLHEVNSRVLTLEFVRDLVLEVNALLDRDAPSLTVRISELKRNLAEVETAIHVLLDLAEQFGAASAASRLLEREGEQRQLQAELRYLEDQRECTRDNVPEEEIQQVLRGMRETLDSTDLEAKRSLLRKLVA